MKAKIKGYECELTVEEFKQLARLSEKTTTEARGQAPNYIWKGRMQSYVKPKRKRIRAANSHKRLTNAEVLQAIESHNKGFSYSAIGKALGRSTGSIANLLYHAKKSGKFVMSEKV